jgi:hypothetical protein
VKNIASLKYIKSKRRRNLEFSVLIVELRIQSFQFHLQPFQKEARKVRKIWELEKMEKENPRN